MLKSLGATEVVDHRDPEAVSKLVALAKVAGTPLRYGFDSISAGNSAIFSANALLASTGKGSKLVMSYTWPEGHAKPDGIEVSQTEAFLTELDLSELGSWLFNDYLHSTSKNKMVVPAPKIQIVGSGIGAAQKVFDQLKAGVSATKLVVNVD